MIRDITYEDLTNLLLLYTQLHDSSMPEASESLSQLWEQMLADKNYHIVVAEENNKIVSSCVLVVVPNLTHSQSPFALVENVITDENYRKQGFAGACLNYAKEIALSLN